MELLLADLPLAILMALIGALVFSLIGIVSGTDETATIAPLTLVVILLECLRLAFGHSSSQRPSPNT